MRRAPAAGTLVPSARAWIGTHVGFVLLALLLGAAIAPVLLTPIPAMVDYVNHLSRMYLLAADGTSDASAFYRVTWAFYPNLAMDIIVPRLARWVNVETAARLFLIASQILVVTGTGAIELVMKRRIALAGPIAVLFIYSVPFAWGFLNFEFAFGIALWGIAAWFVLAERRWAMRLVVHSLFVILLFAGHFFALGLYGFTLGMHELWSIRAGQKSRGAFVATMAMLAAPALIVAAGMHLSGGSIGGTGNVWFFEAKPMWPFTILNGYSIVLSAIEAFGLVLLVHLLVKRRAIRFSASGAWLAIGFAILFVAIPSILLDTAFSDIRVLVAAPLILAAFIEVDLSGRWRMAAGAVVVGFALVNIGTAAAIFASYDATYRTMISSFSRIETGSRVLVAHGKAADDPPMSHLADYPLYHAPTLAVHYAKAFVPTLFTTIGKQPLSPVDSVKDLAFSCGGPVPVALLVSLARHERAPGTVPRFIQDWARDFDYVYVIGDGSASNPLPEILEALQVEPRFTLYRIRTPGRPGARS